MSRPWRWAAVAVVVLALIAVGTLALRRSGGDLESARRHLAANEPASALLTVKAVLQSRSDGPEAAEARRLLGQTHLALGDPAAAEAEFERALQAGLPPSRVAAGLSEALRAQRRSSEGLKRFEAVQPSDPVDAAGLFTQRAWAHADAGQLSAARAALQRALGQEPDFAPALLLQARLRAGAGDRMGAMRQVDAVLAADSRNAAAWILKAELHGVDPGGRAASVEAYRKALSLTQYQLAAHEGLITALIQAGDLPAARGAWQAMSRAFPANGLTAYFDAFLALKQEDPQRARMATQQLLQAGNPPVQVLVLAGQADYRLGAWAQAQAHFARAVAARPDDAVPRQHLAMVLLRQGQAAHALETLQPLMRGTSRNGQAWALAGHAYLLLGESKQSAAAFERAAQLAPNDLTVRTSKAQADLSQGRIDQGMAELSAVAAADPGVTADLALIAERLNRKAFDAALQAIESLSRKTSGAGLADVLRGQVSLARNEPKSAREYFERAMSQSPGELAALQQLARLDLADGKPEAAVKRFDDVLKNDPANVSVLLGRVELDRAIRADPRATLPRLEQALRVNPTDVRVHGALIDQLIAAQDLPSALAAAQAAISVAPSDPGVLERLANLLQRTGDRNQALVFWRRLAALQPLPSAQALRVTQALRVLGASAEADNLAQAAAQFDPDSLATQRAIIVQALQQRSFTQALELSRALQSRRPTEAMGHVLEGDGYAAQGQWDRAVRSYTTALSKRNVGSAPARLHLSLLKSKGKEEAARFQRRWLAQHPDDADYLLFLSQQATATGDTQSAITHLRRVVDIAPNHALAHNNLAHLLWRTRQDGAMASAERAIQLASQVPAFLDTLAMILADGQRLDDALKVQRRALDLAPGSDAIRMNLARLLVKAGDTAAAADELNRLAVQGDRFADHAEVAELRKRLGDADRQPSSDSAPSTTVAAGAVEPESHWSVPVLPAWFWFAVAGALALALPSLAFVAAVRPAAYQVNAEVTVVAPAEHCFDVLQDLRNWSTWSALAAFRAGQTVRFMGPPGSPGSACEWSVGSGEAIGRMDVVQAIRPTKLVVEFSTGGDLKDQAIWLFQLAETEAGLTRVQASRQGRATFWRRVQDLASLGGLRQRRRLAASLDRFRDHCERAPLRSRPREPLVVVSAGPAQDAGA